MCFVVTFVVRFMTTKQPTASSLCSIRFALCLCLSASVSVCLCLSVSVSLCLSPSLSLSLSLMQKVVHSKAPQYLEDLKIASERFHVHGNKQPLPRTRTDIFKTSFSFWGSLAWNSLPHRLRYPMEWKTLKRKALQALSKPPWYFFLPFARHLDTKCIDFFLPCVFFFYICISHKNQLLMVVFSCVIVLSFIFLVVIILMRYIWVYEPSFNVQSC